MTDRVSDKHYRLLRQTIMQAGALAKDYFDSSRNLQVEKKGPKDLVTEADFHTERFIQQQLNTAFPDYGFWGEETGARDDQDNCWIVDPIDGTHSFFKGQYFWSISIALRLGGELVLGAVYAPALDDLYIGGRGDGAYKNGALIHCSQTISLEDAMVGTGFACLRSNLEANNLDRFARIALETAGQRRFGSAALDICMVADGQLDAFWEQHLNLYDIAAGVVIAREAGAIISDFNGTPGCFPDEVLVSNSGIHEAMLALM